MEYIERVPLPSICKCCEVRIHCLARGEGEWCCDECDHLLERFTEIPAVSCAPEKIQRIADAFSGFLHLKTKAQQCTEVKTNAEYFDYLAGLSNTHLHRVL